MTILQSLILGIVQGLTEFLPISSSAHLVLVPYLLQWNIPAEEAFIFNVLVQDGTLVAVMLYFWKDLWAIVRGFVQGLLKRQPFAEADSRMGWYLILATIPAGILGLSIKDTVEEAFASPTATAVFLWITAGLLLAAERISKRSRTLEHIHWKDALWMGAAQALAIFPGISRSGATITGGMLRDLDRPSAARFSFLMSIPVMLAAGLVALLDLFDLPNLSEMLLPVTIGFITAAVTGYLSIRWLLAYLTHKSLRGFAVYCAGVGLIVLILGWIG
ncbi:MAG: undecaprenyl-diphosphatase UppP [Anaerolineales bacterium]|jgi:undecaprenyl-diphosphatase|nr:undecaprenyl-diphosphatase UppP [Anaerolineales bacterium]